MNIGEIKLNANGTFIGRIATFQLAMTIALRPIVSENPRAPKFDIMALNQVAKMWVKVGAFFALTSNSTGDEFLNGRIDDPSLSEPVQVSAFRQEDGSYNVVWQRQQRRTALPASTNAAEEMPPLPVDDAAISQSGTASDSEDGLGISTAPDAPDVEARGRGKRELVDA